MLLLRHRSGPRTSLRHDGRAVSEMVGSALLVMITVVMAVVLAGIIFVIQGPIDTPKASLRIGLDAGTGGWGTGDESIRVLHAGGQPLDASRITITYTVNNAPTTLKGASQLGGAFAAGRLLIGQTWIRNLTLQASDAVTVTVVADGTTGGSALLASTSNLSAGGAGGIATTFIQSGGISSVIGTILNPSGASAVGGTEATFTEAGSTNSVLAGTTTTGSTGVTNPNDALTSNNVRATIDAAPDVLDVSGFTLAGTPGIRSVTIGFEGMKSSSGGTTPTIQLSYSVGGVAGPTRATMTVSATADTLYTVDVTNDRAWTSANIAALQVQLASGTFGSGGNLRTINVDQLYVQVVYSPPLGTGQALVAQLDWAGVPSGSTQTLELGYHVTPAANDVFNVLVWNGTAWRTCPGQLTNTLPTPTAFVCALLLPNEYNGGAPRVRLLDANPALLVPTTLLVDYAKVTTG